MIQAPSAAAIGAPTQEQKTVQAFEDMALAMPAKTSYAPLFPLAALIGTTVGGGAGGISVALMRAISSSYELAART